jgi:hypothetical protein
MAFPDVLSWWETQWSKGGSGLPLMTLAGARGCCAAQGSAERELGLRACGESGEVDGLGDHFAIAGGEWRGVEWSGGDGRWGRHAPPLRVIV